MDKYQKAQADRQRILDALKGKPLTLWQIVCKIDDDKMDDERCGQLLCRMEDLEEVYRTDKGIGRNGKPCALWHAEVTETISADDVRKFIAGNLDGPGEGRKMIRTRREPKVVVKPVARLFGGLG